MNRMFVVCGVLLSFAACTTVNVRPVDAKANPIQLVCIQENPAVLVSDFVSVVEAGFQRHGIQTLVFKDKAPDQCEYRVTYTATRRWDLAPFMNYAELRLQKGDETLSLATYRHSGGFALNKWASTESKMDPVLDELLANFSTQTSR